MTEHYSRVLALAMSVLLAGCVSQSSYDAVVAQNQQLQQQVAIDKAHITRLQGAIKYTVNSDLLFPSGSWQMSADGKDIIAKMAKTLARDQQDKLVVNGYTDNAPVGTTLQRQGQFMVSQGVNAALVSARGFGEADPIATKATRQGRAQNRRVEITIAGSAS